MLHSLNVFIRSHIGTLLKSVHCTVVDLFRLFIVNFCLADVARGPVVYCLLGA